MPMFMEVAGGRIISRTTGQEVLRVDVDALMVDEARKVINAILPALEEAFSRKPEG